MSRSSADRPAWQQSQIDRESSLQRSLRLRDERMQAAGRDSHPDVAQSQQHYDGPPSEQPEGEVTISLRHGDSLEITTTLIDGVEVERRTKVIRAGSKSDDVVQLDDAAYDAILSALLPLDLQPIVRDGLASVIVASLTEAGIDFTWLDGRDR